MSISTVSVSANSSISTASGLTSEGTESSFILSRESFLKAKEAFKKAAQERRITAAHILVWHLIQGKDIQTGFTGITNPNKLANGQDPWAAFDDAFWSARHLREEALSIWSDLLLSEGATVKSWRFEGDHPLLKALTELAPRSKNAPKP